jgi:hypothetical protein
MSGYLGRDFTDLEETNPISSQIGNATKQSQQSHQPFSTAYQSHQAYAPKTRDSDSDESDVPNAPNAPNDRVTNVVDSAIAVTNTKQIESEIEDASFDWPQSLVWFGIGLIVIASLYFYWTTCDCQLVENNEMSLTAQYAIDKYDEYEKTLIDTEQDVDQGAVPGAVPGADQRVTETENWIDNALTV